MLYCLSFFKVTFISVFCVACDHVGMCARPGHLLVQRSEDNLQESVQSFHLVGLGETSLLSEPSYLHCLVSLFLLQTGSLVALGGVDHAM